MTPTQAAPLDLRLVPAAVAAWAAVLVGVWVSWAAALVLAALGAALLLVALVARRRGPGWLQRWSAAALACGAATLGMGLLVATHVHAAENHPLRLAAARGAAATLQVKISDDPRPVLQQGYADQPGGVRRWAISAELRRASIGDTTWEGTGRLLLLAPPEGWDGLLPGQHVSAEGLLAPPSHRDLTAALLRVRGPPRDVAPPPWWQEAAGGVRLGLRNAANVLPEQSAALLPSLVVGDTSQMPASVTDEFRTAGLSHLTAVSGANLAIICGAVLILLRLLRMGPRASAVLAGVALVAFVVVARPSPSVLRAAVMGVIALAALLLGRNRSAMPALAAAVLGLLVLDPELGVEPGFALSVLATGALVLLAPRWAGALRARGVPAGVAEALAVPAAAHLVTAPVVAALSGQVSMVAVVANLLVAPVVAPATVLGAVAAALAVVSDTAAELSARLAGPFVQWLLFVGHHAAGVPGAAVGWPSGMAGGLLLAACVAVALLLLRLRRLRTLIAAAVLGCMVVLVPTRFAPPGWPATGWAMVACDVGQGDAIVLATGEPGQAVLVDAGPEPAVLDGCLGRLGVRQVPLIMLSHLHADHVGGLAAALDGASVGAVAVGPSRQPKWAYEQVRQLAERAGVPLLQLQAGQRLQWSSLVIEVLAPDPASGRQQLAPLDSPEGTEVNDNSVVLRADTTAGRVLLTGDVELAGQSSLLRSGVDLQADVLKVPHHGSRYSLPEFLATVRPRVALVSVGAGNTYRHPNREILTALATAGATVLRTDQHGDIAVLSDDSGLSVVSRGDPQPPPGGRP